MKETGGRKVLAYSSQYKSFVVGDLRQQELEAAVLNTSPLKESTIPLKGVCPSYTIQDLSQEMMPP